MKIIDLHCDTVSWLRRSNGALLKNEAQYDLERARNSDMYLQFFAMFTLPTEPNIALREILKQMEKFNTELEHNSSRVFQVKKFQDLHDPNNRNKLAAVLHLEGGECLGNDLEILSLLYRAGLRSLGLTWNNRNQLADGLGEGQNGGGLSMMGREVAAEMERLGMLLDLSHIAVKSFYDALGCYQKPILVSHANAYSLCQHWRNLDDSQLKALAEHGGLIGITQVADFVSETQPSTETMIDHMVYIAELIGVEHVALGSDFDGADNMVIKDVAGYSQLPELLAKRGFTQPEIEMILHKNALSILEQVL